MRFAFLRCAHDAPSSSTWRYSPPAISQSFKSTLPEIRIGWNARQYSDTKPRKQRPGRVCRAPPQRVRVLLPRGRKPRWCLRRIRAVSREEVCTPSGTTTQGPTTRSIRGRRYTLALTTLSHTNRARTYGLHPPALDLQDAAANHLEVYLTNQYSVRPPLSHSEP